MQSWPSLAPFAQNLTMPGGNLFYYDSGGDDSGGDNDPAGGGESANGKPTVILIHGLGDEADTWRYVFPALVGAGYRVIAPDLPGFGRSLWKGKISMHGHYRAIRRLMTATGAAGKGKPAVLVGSSLGAGIGEIVACYHPRLVKGLILLDGCFPFPYKLDRGFFLVYLPFVVRDWYRGFRKNHEAAWRSLYPYYGDLGAMSEADRDFLRERVIARVESANQERGYLATMRSMNTFIVFNSHIVSRKIQAYPGKIALLWGEKDRIFLQERAALIRTLRPDAEFITIAGAGHLPHQEKPDACIAEIMRFLNEE